MANRLQPLNLTDFTGGLNARRNQFQLADNESPDLLNVDIDPRGGFFTRRGWQRWNTEEDIVDLVGELWRPRNAYLHTWSNGQQYVYVANEGIIYVGDDLGVFTMLTTDPAQADPHDADFAAWGDDIYFVIGRAGPAYRRTGIAAPVALGTTFSEIEAPVTGQMPHAEHIETHAGYVFVANTREGVDDHPNRVRWSHPNVPDAFREGDFIDIETGGSKITGLVSFSDHLLIFKGASLWALYGYEDDSFQLVRVSDKAGAPTTTATTRSESAVYFFSQTDRGGIYAYNGNQPVYLSERLATVFEQVFSHDNVFVSWAGRRLWVAVPWTKQVGSTAEPSSAFVFDPTIGEAGAWVSYQATQGAIATVLDGGNAGAKFPLAAVWSEVAAAMVTLDFSDDAYDVISLADVLVTDLNDDLVTDLDDEIGVSTGHIGEGFDSYYRTRWLHAGWPDRKKSWRRPTLICREVGADTDLIVESYRNYDESFIHRTKTVHLHATGGAMWTEGGIADEEDGGFNWTELGEDDPTGADWGLGRGGSNLIRSGSMGLAKAVQMQVRASPVTPRRRWGVDGIVTKFVLRRFR